MSLRAVATDDAPSAIGPYSQGIDAGNLVFVAGQVGRDPVSGDLADDIEGQTERAMKNIQAILEAAGLTWANVAKTTCLLANIEDFQAFNAVYVNFVSEPRPARATYAVKALPGGALIEIEAFAVR
ncbi:MAG TPA: Rid family detoxifying hydrolase [Candidatus Limnocylindrales bacterium]|nr:Rid family detoxifying hydrolase [Candidatus Limnocylindrales bacterium]